MLGENRDQWTQFLPSGSTQTFGEIVSVSSWLHYNESSAIMWAYAAEEHSRDRRDRQVGRP